MLPSKAFKSPFALPQDINSVFSDNLLKLGAYNQDTQWMVVAGWEFQDLSPSWTEERNSRATVYELYPLVNLCATLQLLQPAIPPAFLFENTAMETHKDPNISVWDFEVIFSIIG
jgi:hypothetical protein